MWPSSMKMLMLLFFAAAIMNVTNYLFCEVYDPLPSNKPREMYYTILGKQLRIPRLNWTPEIICENISTKSTDASRIKFELIVNLTSKYRASENNVRLSPELPTSLYENKLENKQQ